MLTRRLIPKVLVSWAQRRPQAVTTVQFRERIPIGTPFAQATIYQAQGADELLLLDLDATNQHRIFSLPLLEQIADAVFMPLTVGGGIRSVADICSLLQAGADKVCLNTAAFENEGMIAKAAETFGSQCLVVSLDYRVAADGSAEVCTHGGQQPTGLELVSCALRCAEFGAGELCVTCMDRDGMRRGLDVALIRRLAESLPIPFIVSGGCGTAAHCTEGFAGGADAVACGTLFGRTDQTPLQVRAHLANAGIPVRPPSGAFHVA